MIEVCVPMHGTEDESEEFYDLLQKIVVTTPKSDPILVMEDLNARVGNNRNC
jgi:hypothetical protein